MPDQTATQSTQVPQFLMDRLQNLTSRAEAESQRGYAPYGGPRIASFAPQQQQAFDLTGSSVGSYQPYISNATNLFNKTGELFNQQDFEKFLNPNTSAVVDRLGVLAGRNLEENLLPKVNQTFTGAGQFGSRGNYEFTNRALRDTQEALLAQQNEALQGAFDKSMGNYSQALDRLGETAKGYLGAGNQLQQQQGTDIRNLLTSGGLQQDQTQRNYDLAYSDFEKQRNYPQQQIGFFSDVLRGVANPAGTSTTTTQQTQSPSTLSQLANLAGTVGIGLLKKKGSKVKDAAPKGGMRLGYV